MKKIILAFSATMLCLASFATVRTVSNFLFSAGSFSTIQAGIDASVSGDTIYVSGSPNGYAGFTITNKQLTIIGAGWAPDKNLGLTSAITNSSEVHIIGAASTNTEIQGLTFSSGIHINVNNNVPSGLRFIRNNFAGNELRLNGTTTYSNYLFEGNVFDNSTITGNASATFQNILFQNNLFVENGCCRNGNINSLSNCVNVLFDHNLWYGGNRSCFTGTCRFINLTNNIFVGRNPSSGLSSSTFSNNLTFNCADNTPWNSNSNVNASNSNIANQDPLMAAQATANGSGTCGTCDFTIASSIANNAGSDGKDIGLLFDANGSLNWTRSRTSILPYIVSMNLQSPNVTSGGNITVTIEARKN